MQKYLTTVGHTEFEVSKKKNIEEFKVIINI